MRIHAKITITSLRFLHPVKDAGFEFRELRSKQQMHIHHIGQGRNFGLKSGGTNSERERGAIRSRGEMGGYSQSIPSSSDSGVCESVVSSVSGVRGEARPKRVLL